jgi:hypothetical protein
MVFNTTFSNISVISYWSVLLVDETGVPGENHWQTNGRKQQFLINFDTYDKHNEPKHCDKEDNILYPYDKESTNHKTDSNLWYFIVVMLVYFF